MFSKIATDSNFWNKISTDLKYKKLVDNLLKNYNNFDFENGIPSVRFSEFRLFYDNGNRLIYEKPYFEKRTMLNICAILSLIYPENDEYLKNLEDVIWAICDEYTWVLPAHIPNYPETNYYTIDLFSAETGFALSEIKYLLSDRLNPLIINRIDDEIEGRIIVPFANNDQRWENMPNNWAAVCAGSVAITFMYQAPELYDSVKERIEKTIDKFLDGYPDDGVCLEGLAYWDYGFGFFVRYADALCDFTNGEVNLFRLEKVKQISGFFAKMYLTDDVVVSFSDGSDKISLSPGLIHQLKSIYPDDVPSLPDSAYDFDLTTARWCQSVRDFVFYNPDCKGEKLPSDTQYYFEDAQWFIKKTPVYSFAIKGGTNDEPHNHNDIGSFILARGDRQTLVDLGSGRYTKDYFTPETRYSILCNNSFGHSVPIINGNGQGTGHEYKGSMKTDGDTVCIDMKNAYNEPSLKVLDRKIEFSEKIITLTDTFEFDGDGSYVCRLVSRTAPEYYDNNVVVGLCYIEYDNSSWEVKVTEEKHTPHTDGADINVFLIDFVPKKKVNSIELKIKAYEQLKMTSLLKDVPPYEIADGFEIRMFTPGDEQAWTDICKFGLLEANEGIECWDKYMLCFKTLVPEKDTYFVYNSDNKAIATCTCFVEECGTGNMHMLAAMPESRGHKLGWAMTTFALNKISKELSADKRMVRLKSDDWRLPAVRSYLKAGYQPVLYDVGMEERWKLICEKLNLHGIEMLDEDGNPTGIIL